MALQPEGNAARSAEYAIVLQRDHPALLPLGSAPPEQLDGLGREWQPMGATLLRALGGLHPNRGIEIEIGPAHSDHLAAPAAGVQQHAEHIAAVAPLLALLLEALQHRHEARNLVLAQIPLAVLLA